MKRMLSETIPLLFLLLQAGCGGGTSPGPPPEVSLSASMTYVKAGEPVTFDVSVSDSSGTWVSSRLDFGDGTSVESPGAQETHVFSAEGVYTVTLRAENGAGGSSSVSVEITVTPAGGPPSIRLNGVTLHIDLTDGPVSEVLVNQVSYPVQSGHADVFIPLGDGIVPVDVSATDPAGNQGSEHIEFEIQ